MKKLSLIPFGVLVLSCTAVKQINKQEVSNPKGCQSFDIRSGTLMLKVAIDDNELQLPFDSGAPISTIEDTAVVKDFHKKEIGSLGSVMGADRSNKTKNNRISVKFKSEVIDSDNKIVTLLPMPKSKCAISSVKGIIGLDCFFNQDYPMFLNFSDGKICNIDRAEMQNRLADKGYREIKSQCRLNSIYIYAMLAGKELKLKFDTGYSGQMIVPSDLKVDLSIYNKFELQGRLFTTATAETNGLETYFEKVPLGLGEHKFFAKPIVSGTISSQIIGLELIKGFDWIIDYNNNKVYAKRNHIKIDDTFNRKVSYYAKADKKLIIMVKEAKQTKYNLGDEIISVNGQKVTEANNCEMQALLNQTDDWSTLNLEVVPVSK